jgi:hypothetical protein
VELGAVDDILISGSIQANGAAGQNSFSGFSVGGGGGSGGGILVHAADIDLDPTASLQARGGNGGDNGSTTLPGGGSGGGGRVLVAYSSTVANDGVIDVSAGTVLSANSTAGSAGVSQLELIAGSPVSETYTYTINWGDGSPVVTGSSVLGGGITVTPPSGGLVTGTFGASHQYSDDRLYSVTVTVTDSAGTKTEIVSQTVNNVAPMLAISGAPSANEGLLYTLSLSSSDPGADAISAWTINWGDGPAETISGNPASVTHTYADGNSASNYVISATATDEDGVFAAGNTVPLTVNNIAPVLTLSPVAAVDENGTATLNLSFTDQGVLDQHTFTINWGDGSTNQVVTIPVGDRSAMFSHQYLDDTPTGTASDNYSVTVSVNDGDGGSDSDVASVTVNNLAPVLGAIALTTSGACTPVIGQTVSLAASFTDVGTLDTHTALINWGDGVITSGIITESSGNGSLSDSHVYAVPGNYTVSVTLADDDSGQSTGTAMTAVAGAYLNPVGGILEVFGTHCDDSVSVYKSSTSTLQVIYSLGGVAMPTQTFSLSAVQEIQMYLDSGDDYGFVSQNLAIPAIMFGGAGADTLIGGNGHDRLLGGAGDDILIGRHGYDILIGGDGVDMIVGDSGSDILVGGPTLYDDNLAALDVIWDEWTSSDSYATRVAKVTGAQGSLAYTLRANETVFDDGDLDVMSGGGDKDLFFASLECGWSDDLILDLQRQEFVEELEV